MSYLCYDFESIQGWIQELPGGDEIGALELTDFLIYVMKE